MSNSARFRAFSNTLFSKTAWIATVALVASLLVVVPIGGQAANAVPAVVPTSISVGDSHSCAVVQRGVQCWGSNNNGQLGVLGIPASSSAVQTIPANSGVTQVSAGYGHTCAVVAGGVKCWGRNGSGQLGDGSTTKRAQPVSVIDANSGVTQVSAGDQHTCAIVAGAVYCWGDNANGQLGYDMWDSTKPKTPFLVPGISGATSVSVNPIGSNVSCAVVDDGVMCWGQNMHYQLGTNAQFTSSNATSYVMTHVPQLVGGTAGADSVSVGGDFVCAVISAGVKCWGNNDSGQLGTGLQEDALGDLPRFTPVQTIATTAGVTQVSASNSFSCAVVTAGVMCWGDGNGDVAFVPRAQPGGATDLLATPTLLDDLADDVVSVGVGGDVACALLENSLKCWGSNWDGQLGQGDLLYSASAVDIHDFEGLTQLASGDGFSCALADGAVWCWGSNEDGQLGSGTFSDSSTVPVLAIESEATQISVGDDHACAIVRGDVMCWGSNEDGKLGFVPSSSNPGMGIPAAINYGVYEGVSEFTSGTVTRLAAGRDHTCASSHEEGVTHDVVRCWGANWDDELGDPSGTEPNDKVATVDFSNSDFGSNYYDIFALTAGAGVTCAIYADSAAFCWGDESHQTGAYNPFSDPNFSGIEVLSPVYDISTGLDSSCAISDASVGNEPEIAVSCWGYNDEGQLGQDGLSDADSSSPRQVAGAEGAIAVSVGDEYSCAIVAGGVKCWGLNNLAQLGNNNNASSHTPTDVVGLPSGVTLLAAGVDHACAAIRWQVKCWGNNDGEVLGVPKFYGSATPIVASGALSAANVNEDENQQSSTVDHTSLLKPELAKANRISVLKTGQRITLTGSNLSNVQSVLVGSKTATIVSIVGSEIIIDVPADLVGSPQVTLVSKSGVQIIDGLIQIVQPYRARSVKVSSFTGNAITKDAAAVIRKSYLRDASVNIVSCAAVIGQGASAKTKAATIAKSLSACKTVSGYSVKFKTFKTVLRTLDAPLKTPFVTVTFGRSKPSLVN